MRHLYKNFGDRIGHFHMRYQAQLHNQSQGK